ncbi:hypothetical protein M2333_003104 [Sphingobium sp. B11D3B]|uniref:TniQ family protein n=1 Tax=Sphingobium sp. B11D3B TaxID=2940575 RepID=UPI00222789E2|nr:TniQ family protein [Sphingobium sp. B11D3B]MCW2390058.1 hypothetical protein [Sphingobium sp. B11D3B]
MFDAAKWMAPEPGSGRVLFPLAPFAGESLLGLVARVARDNLHSSIASITNTAGYPHIHCYDLDRANLDRLPALARTLGVDIAELEARSHPVVNTPGPAAVDFFGARVVACDLKTRVRRFSPTTVSDEPFYRAIWQHRLLPYCPVSLELLISRCPGCGRGYGWYHTCEVGTCEHCGYRAVPCDTNRVPDEYRDAYRRMASLLDPSVPARPYQHVDLNRLGRGELFEMGLALGAALADLPDLPRGNLYQCEPAQIAMILSLGDEIMSNWPGSLERTVAGRLNQAPVAEHRLILQRLKRVCYHSKSWPEIIAILRAATPKFFGTLRSVHQAIIPERVMGTDVGKALRISAGRFAQLKRSGAITAVTKSGKQHRFEDFNSSDVNRLADAFCGRLRAATVAERLGITFHGVEQLICLGLLEWENDPALLCLWNKAFTTKLSFASFVSTLEQKSTVPHTKDSAWRPIKHVLKRVGRREKPFGPVMREMIERKLPFNITEGSARLFDRIRVPSDTCRLVESLRFDRNDYPDFFFEDVMPRRDAESVLNITTRVSAKALAGLSDKGQPIPIKGVLSLANKYISSGEIKERWLGASAVRPSSYLKKAGILANSPAGWLRNEVEQYFNAASQTRSNSRSR